MAKLVAFKAAHRERNVGSHWNRKVTSSKTCRRLRTIESQDDCVRRNPDVSLSHVNATGGDDVRKLVHKLLLRAILEVTVLNDTPGSVEALVGPNSHRDVQERSDIFQFAFLFFTTKLYHEVTTTLFGDAMGLGAQNLNEFSLDFER